MLIDTHCHLDFPEFAADLPNVISRAGQAGVERLITISTHISKLINYRAIAHANENIFYTAGVHPHHAAEPAEVITTEQLIELAQDPKLVAYGECGLDYHYEYSPRLEQAACFRKHLAACRVTGLPVVIHTRECDEDMLDILKSEEIGQGFSGVLHCFSSGRALAEAAIDMGMFISFSGILTFKKSIELREIAKDLPLDRLLVETDAPFLAPQPWRGKVCEPAYVAHTASILAEIKQISPKEIADITTANARKLFFRLG